MKTKKYFKNEKSLIRAAINAAVEYERSFIDAHLGTAWAGGDINKLDPDSQVCVRKSIAAVADWITYLKKHR